MIALLPACLAGAGVAVAIGLPGPPRRVLGPATSRTLPTPPGAVVAVLVGAVAVVPLGPAGAAVAALLAVVGQRAYETHSLSRRRTAERLAAAEAMSVLAAELRAGRPPAAALAAAASVAQGPVRVALKEAAGTTGLGGAVPEVLERHAPASAVPELLRGLAVCWTVCQGAGSSLAVAVDRLDEGLRAQRLQDEEVEAELAGPKASAFLLAVLPAIGVLMGAGLGAHPTHVLLHTAAGQVCLVIGVVLDLLGVLWTRRIVRSAGGTT